MEGRLRRRRPARPRRHGRAGRRAAVRQLPDLQQLARERLTTGLELGESYPADCSSVRRAWLPDGTACVLKQAYDESARVREIEALGLLGSPSVRLLQVLPDAVLLERVEPGDALSDEDDDAATRVLADAMRRMWRAVPAYCSLPTVEQECASLYDGRWTDPLPAALVSRARSHLEELLATAPEPVVLHGDLHHGNLLRGPDGWVAIDPHGVVGDPGFEVWPMLTNPHTREVAHLASRRVDVLSEALGTARERLRRWGLVGAVLSAAWTVEGGGGVDARTLRVAEALNQDGCSR